MPVINTLEERKAYDDLIKHCEAVKVIGADFITALKDRLEKHDESKFSNEEFPELAKSSAKLFNLTYPSPEYDENLAALKKTLSHHYANSRHHPEHYANGVKDMTLLDIIEMYIDWFAATKKHHDGNLRLSIEANQKRFGFSDELKQIFDNTIELFDK